MAFEELQERLKSEAQSVGDRISETPLAQTLKDRYETLSPFGQKAVVAAGIGLIVLIVGLVPYNTYVDSTYSMTDFEEKRSLIRDLLRTHKEAQETAGIPLPPAVSEVQSRIDGFLNASQLLPEQKKGIVSDAPSGLINSSLVAGVLRVTLSQLNLRQVTNLSADLANIQGAKLKDILMDASTKDPRYYDVVYRVVVFKSNAPPVANDGAPPPSGRGR